MWLSGGPSHIDTWDPKQQAPVEVRGPFSPISTKGYDVKSGLVRPQDIAATVFRHLGIDLGAHWSNPQGRPIPIVVEGGRPIPELT